MAQAGVAEGRSERGSAEFPDPIGRKRMIRYPAGEQITVPRHIPTRRVRTMIACLLAGARGAGPGAPLLTRPMGLAMRTPLRRAVGAMISRLPEGPSAEDRAAARFTIVCDVTRAASAAVA